MFVDQRYHTWDALGAKTQKGDYKDQKPSLHSFKWLKRAIGLKTCFRGAFDNILVFVYQKYHTWDTLGAKTQKEDYIDQKPNLCSFKWLKRAIGLKTCFGGAFDQLLAFVDQKYHTWDTLSAKTQKGDYKDQKPNLCSFKWLKWAIGLKTCFGSAFDKRLVFVDQKHHTLEILWALKPKKEITKIKTKLAFL